jgi:hypothetical protein
MTLTTLITVNAVLGAITTYGIVWLLATGIGHDRRQAEHHLRSLTSVEPVRDRDQVAA